MVLVTRDNRVYLEHVEIVVQLVQLVQLVNKELMNLLVLLVHRELLVLKVRLENQGQRGKDGRPEGILMISLVPSPTSAIMAAACVKWVWSIIEQVIFKSVLLVI